jgi:signal peptidase I
MQLEMKPDEQLGEQHSHNQTPDPASRLTRSRWKSLFKNIFFAVLIVGLSYGSFQFITSYVMQSVHVVGQSMSPTLQDNENYVLNRWVYRVRDPKPTEIVVLRDPADNCYAVKRIVAKQGDTVVVKKGHLFVNGKELQEPYLPEGTPTFPGPLYDEQMWICGVNQYFVLGDNRNNSADSRIYGAVSRQNILGMVTP